LASLTSRSSLNGSVGATSVIFASTYLSTFVDRLALPTVTETGASTIGFTVAPSATAAAGEPQTADSDLRIAVAAGVGGGVLLLLTAAVLLWFLLRRRHRRRNAASGKTDVQLQHCATTNSDTYASTGVNSVYEDVAAVRPALYSRPPVAPLLQCRYELPESAIR